MPEKTRPRRLNRDGALPEDMWGEMMTTTTYLANRSPHAALGGKTPLLILHGKEADYCLLRTIGARGFVHIEQHTPKVQGKIWQGRVVDYWTSFAADPDAQNSTTGYINSDTTGR